MTICSQAVERIKPPRFLYLFDPLAFQKEILCWKWRMFGSVNYFCCLKSSMKKQLCWTTSVCISIPYVWIYWTLKPRFIHNICYIIHIHNHDDDANLTYNTLLTYGTYWTYCTYVTYAIYGFSIFLIWHFCFSHVVGTMWLIDNLREETSILSLLCTSNPCTSILMCLLSLWEKQELSHIICTSGGGLSWSVLWFQKTHQTAANGDTSIRGPRSGPQANDALNIDHQTLYPMKFVCTVNHFPKAECLPLLRNYYSDVIHVQYM
jgi:hypothetical protein